MGGAAGGPTHSRRFSLFRLVFLNRLLWVEVSMMCVLLFMGLWQIHYLKRYFQTKKLI